MIIGIPKEIKTAEWRVSLTPEAVRQLVGRRHRVLVQKGAGVASGFPDIEYRRAGAVIVSSFKDVYRQAELVLKVKEPQPQEYSCLRPGLNLFTFLHVAANRPLLRALLKKKVTAIAYETVESKNGNQPILAPMSEIAGLLAPLIGANYLRKDMGGKGVLLPSVGVGGAGRVTVIGAGRVGSSAVKIAHGLGALVTVYDVDVRKLKKCWSLYGERVQILSEARELPEIIKRTDLLIGAVLIPGQKTPLVVTRQMVEAMDAGSVVFDVAVDQGGCIETARPTTLAKPVFERSGVLHYGATNIPSLVPRSATEALVSASLPYIIQLADKGFEKAFTEDRGFQKGLCVQRGEKVFLS